MAFGDTIQSVDNNNAIAGAGALAVTLTFPGTATVGNLLRAFAAVATAVTSWTDPSGWTRDNDSGTTGNMAGAAYWKISDGTETSVVLTANVAGAASIRGAFGEFEGPFAASPFDQSAEDTTNVATVTTSQPSGTTGTTAQADELAIAAFGADAANLVDGGRAYSNSFTEVIYGSTTTLTGRPAAIIAKRVLSATGTFSCTYTTTDTGDEMYGTIATFKKQVATGRIFKLAGEGGGLVGPSRGLVG